MTTGVLERKHARVQEVIPTRLQVPRVAAQLLLWRAGGASGEETNLIVQLSPRGGDAYDRWVDPTPIADARFPA